MFFRGLGRAYGILGLGALAVALASGAILAAGHRRDGRLTAAVVVAAALVLTATAGIIQARHMIRLRRHALPRRDDPTLAARVARGARRAHLLRPLIGILSLALLALGVLLTT
jgi:hypothetical protein